MTDREALIQVTETALIYCRLYDNACPDVGTGPSNETLLARILQSSNVSLTEAEKKRILTHVKEPA